LIVVIFIGKLKLTGCSHSSQQTNYNDMQEMWSGECLWDKQNAWNVRKKSRSFLEDFSMGVFRLWTFLED